MSGSVQRLLFCWFEPAGGWLWLEAMKPKQEEVLARW
jgi:hypothetical protein